MSVRCGCGNPGVPGQRPVPLSGGWGQSPRDCRCWAENPDFQTVYRRENGEWKIVHRHGDGLESDHAPSVGKQ